MSFYHLVYTLCALELIDLIDLLNDNMKAILMILVTIVSFVIQLWRKKTGKKDKTEVEDILDKISNKLQPENKKELEEIDMPYEVGMSPLVQDICNLYAQNNGLNYPPCTQQMINAVTEWLNNNAIKAVKSVTSNNVGNNVTLTITYTRPNGTTVEDNITFTIPTVKGEDGKDGTNGVDGKDGRGVTAFASGTPVQEDGYTVTPVTAVFTDGTSNSSFNVKAKNGLQGPKGDKGDRGLIGAVGPQGERGIEGPRGPEGIQGPRGQRGPAGADGRSFEIVAHVDSVNNLPSPTAAYLGKAYSVGTTLPEDIYICMDVNGVLVWHNEGPIQGPTGPAGADGAQGPAGPAGEQGPAGEEGRAGNGVVGITTLGYEQGTGTYAGYTKTNIVLNTDEENMPFAVYARNGVNTTEKYISLTVNNNSSEGNAYQFIYPVGDEYVTIAVNPDTTMTINVKVGSCIFIKRFTSGAFTFNFNKSSSTVLICNTPANDKTAILMGPIDMGYINSSSNCALLYVLSTDTMTIAK